MPVPRVSPGGGSSDCQSLPGAEAPPAAGALPRQGAAGPQQADHPALFQPCVLFQLRGLSPALLHGLGLKPPNPAPVQAQPGTRSPRHPVKVCAPQRQGRAQPSHGTRSVLLPALWLQLLPRHCSPGLRAHARLPVPPAPCAARAAGVRTHGQLTEGQAAGGARGCLPTTLCTLTRLQ